MSTMGWVVLVGGVFMALALLFAWVMVRMAGAKTPFEQAREDQDQVEYLRQWSERKGRR